MVMFLALHPMEFIFLNSSDLLDVSVIAYHSLASYKITIYYSLAIKFNILGISKHQIFQSGYEAKGIYK